jgi:SAM-dependent methyltransferase
MTGELEFRTDLYRGTAPYYDRYRPPYPPALFDDLRQRVPVSDGGRLLDLACGTGQIAVPLAKHFSEVWAVDQEAESVAYGEARAKTRGINNITWVTGSAETVVLSGSFELIAVGNAFHRLNRPVVAERMRSWLKSGAGVALVWGNSPWRGDRPWQRTMDELFVDWMAGAAATDGVPAGWKAAIARDPHEQVLRRVGFDYVGKFEFRVEQVWTVEMLIGFVYSTSFLNRQVLGDRAADFERHLTERLLSCQADGLFHESASYAYELARVPQVQRPAT